MDTSASSIASSPRKESQAPCEFDCSKFSHGFNMTPSPSLASSSVSSTSSLHSQLGGTLARSHGVHNLSALGGACYETSGARRQTSSRAAVRDEGWGYFVDSRTS